MVDLTDSHYSTGTATVAAGGTAVTGQGTNWAGAIRPGDLFGTHVGLPIRILSVDSNTSLTLAHKWPGAAQTAAAYEIQRTPYDVGYRQAIEDLVTGISEGNLPLLAALAGAADKIPYFDSDNSMALANFPAWARSMLSQQGAADKIPYLTGANGAALTTLSSLGRSLIGDASGAAALATLGTTAFWRERIMSDMSAADVRSGLSLGEVGSHAPTWTGDIGDVGISGFYRYHSSSGSTGGPTSFGTVLHISRGSSNNEATQIFQSVTGPINGIWTRSKVSNTWSPWAALHSEYGSNSAGSYLRLGDGTQISWRSDMPLGTASSVNGAVFITGLATWSFPASFSSPPAVYARGKRASGSGVVWMSESEGGISTSAVSGNRGVAVIQNAEIVADMMAIGRWS